MPRLATCLRAALAGGALAGPVAALFALLHVAHGALFSAAITGPVDLLGLVAIVGIGTFFGLLVALLAGFPVMVAMSALSIRQPVLTALIGALLGATTMHLLFMSGSPMSIPQISVGAIVGFVCGGFSALMQQRSNTSIERTCPGEPGHAAHVKR